MILPGRLLTCVAAAALCFTGAAFDAAAQSNASRGARAQESKPEEPAPQKKTSVRPEDRGGADGRVSPPAVAAKHVDDPNAARYTYEFSHPDFVVHFIHIEHDAAGRGLMRFERRSDAEQVTEPFELSPAALSRIGAHWAALNFLDSTADYQGARHYPSYGKTRLSMRQGGRGRTAEFNYSADPAAQALAQEYRRAADQALFVFDLKVALESQPLETPKLLSRLEALIRLDGLSDKQQLVPLLRDLSTDERAPLIGRNHAARLLKKLEK